MNMNFLLTIKTEYPAVFSVNGIFTEAKRPVTLRCDEVYFITVFPLCASLLSYTVKITGAKVNSNTDLAILTEITPRQYLIRLLPRYGFVYHASEQPTESNDDVPIRFFKAIKADNLVGARALLSSSLSASVSDGALGEFFDGFDDIFASNDVYFLIDSSGKSHPYSFVIKNNLIDDVYEKMP